MDIQQSVETYHRTQDPLELKKLVKMLEKYAFRETIKINDEHEAKSDLNYVIFKAVEKYDPSKKIKFITYFWRAYKNHAIKQFVRNTTQKRMPKQREISLQEQFLDDGTEFEWCVPSKTRELQSALFQADFLNLVSKIADDKDAFIIKKLYEGYEQFEIAKMLGLTRSAVNQRIRKFHEKTYSEQLRKLLKDYIAEVNSE